VLAKTNGDRCNPWVSLVEYIPLTSGFLVKQNLHSMTRRFYSSKSKIAQFPLAHVDWKLESINMH